MTLTKSEILADETLFQRACSAYVDHNVMYCVSSLMSPIGQDIETAAKLFDEDYEDMMSWFVVEDWETPVLDYIESADLDDLERIADMVGYWSDVIGDIPTAIEKEDDDGDTYYEVLDMGIIDSDEDDANRAALEASIDTIRTRVKDLITTDDEYREIAEDFGLDPEQHEVYEHWLVDRYFARELEDHGERTFGFCNLVIWGRCATGQSISMDYVVRQIVRELDDNHWVWGTVR